MKIKIFVDCSFYTEVYNLQRQMRYFRPLQRQKSAKNLG